eukprot:11330483-Karenia_brevis.AAC.1
MKNAIAQMRGQFDDGSAEWAVLTKIWQAYHDFRQKMGRLRSAAVVSDEELWQVYVRAVCSERWRYYFSYNELALIAKLAQ